ncbi:MAG: CPBP family intramembrane glutamic endopeptidase [Chthoniobacterales bacterium]
MKDALRLLIYLAASVLFAALLAPPLFWAGQALAALGPFRFLAGFDFETFFHRALLIALVILLWPLLRSMRVRSWRDLSLEPNERWPRDLLAGFLLAAVPLLLCGVALIALGFFSLRSSINWLRFAQLAGSSLVVPIIEETFFRGLVLGILLRSLSKHMSIFLSAALFAVVHFLKAPEQTSPIVTWLSGFNSIAHSFRQFSNPTLVTAAFATLLLLGLVLADARLRTRSLWLAIGLHGGWIFAKGGFQLIARRELLILPWLGKNLLVGIVPLALAGLTWSLMRGWLKHVDTAKA